MSGWELGKWKWSGSVLEKMKDAKTWKGQKLRFLSPFMMAPRAPRVWLDFGDQNSPFTFARVFMRADKQITFN